LMRVFWPLDFPRNSQPGVLVGWRNSALDIFVVDILNGLDVGSLHQIGLRKGRAEEVLSQG
jgi:hypothetical protein